MTYGLTSSSSTQAAMLSSCTKSSRTRHGSAKAQLFLFALEDKIVANYVAVHESLHGPERHLVRRSDMSAIGGRADVACARSK